MTGDRDVAREAEAEGAAEANEEPLEAPAEGPLAIARAALEAGQEVVAPAVEETISVARAALGRAGRAFGTDGAARQRRLRRRAKELLPLLYDVHPEARRALPHALGLRTIAVEDIAGSAVEPTQRGGDFLPLPALRTADWRARWQRLRAANERLAHFPPIDAIRFLGRYWVTDGHNRVALALYEAQPEIDANITELHLPGERTQPAGSLVPLLGESRETTRARPAPVRSTDPERER